MKPHTIKLGNTFVAFLVGIVLGIFILIYLGFTTRWIVSYSIALIILFISMSLKNPKHFLLSLFFLSLLIGTYNYIGRLSRLHTGGIPGFYITFYDFVLLMLYILWISKIFNTKTAKIRFTKLDLCFMGLFGMSFLSMYNASDIKFCIYGIFRLIIIYLAFFYMENAITTKRDLKFTIVPILIGLFLESLLGIFQYYRGQVFGLGLIGERQEMMYFRGISRVGGTFGHPNNFAIYLCLFLPLVFSFFFAPLKKEYKVICGLIFLISVSTLILTLSRGGWISFIVSMVIFFVLGLKARLISLRRAMFVVIICIIFLAIIIFAFQELIFTRIYSYDYGSAYSRIPLMKVAMNMIKAHPFLGVGINNYTEVMHLYDDIPRQIIPVGSSGVHNSYLGIASEIGIMGLFFFLWFVALLYKQGIKIMGRNDKLIVCLTIGILAGISAFLISIMVDNSPLVSRRFSFFWILSGITVALGKIRKR